MGEREGGMGEGGHGRQGGEYFCKDSHNCIYYTELLFVTTELLFVTLLLN